jgi:hypothetical protein
VKAADPQAAGPFNQDAAARRAFWAPLDALITQATP